MNDSQHPMTSTPDPATAGGADSARAVGARLAELRTEKGWSIDDISARLKVGAGKLRALEAGDLKRLPDVTFAIGLVRSYAKMLGVDPVPLTNTLRRAQGPIEPDLSLPASSGGGLPRGRVDVSWNGAPKHRSWLWGVALVVLVVLALALWRNGGGSASWLARLKTSAEPASEPTADESAAASITEGTAAAPDDMVSSAAPVDGQAQLPHPALPNDTAASAQTLAAVALAPTELASAPGAAPAQAASQADALAAGQALLDFKVSQDSWINVRQSDGKEVFSGIVRAGSDQQVSGAAPFKVVVGNRAGLTSLEMDGKPVDASRYGAAKGNVSRFSLP